MALRFRRRDRVGTPRLRTDIVTALGAVAVAVLLPLATLLVSTWLHGWQLQAVQSASMEPTYPVGSLLVIEPIDASKVRPGMALVFEDPTTPGRLVVHRVVGPAPGGQVAFLTQGDANASRDPVPVPARMVRGQVKWQVTELGHVLTWLQWPRSSLLIAVPLGLLVASEWLERRRKAAEAATMSGATKPAAESEEVPA
jgi:signal peptidase I